MRHDTHWQRQHRLAMEAEGCRQLWIGVVLQAARDLLSPSNIGDNYASGKLAQRQVESWLGGRDFRKICALAGLDAEAVESRLRSRLADLRAGRLDPNLTNQGRGNRYRKAVRS